MRAGASDVTENPAATIASPELTIVLPALNEERFVAQILATVTKAFPASEVILVSDGSTDRTSEIAAGFGDPVKCIHYHPNRGKGYAVRQGMLAASGKLVVFTDTDLPFGVEGLRNVVDRLRSDSAIDIAIASKTGIHRGLTYRVARHMARAGIALLTGLRYPDTQAGLKGFRAPIAKTIYSRTQIDGFASDIEVLYLAKRKGLRVAVLPMPVAGGVARPSTFGISHGWRLLRDVGRIRLGR